MIHFGKNTPWYARIWYTYTILICWWYYDKIHNPIEKFVVKMAHKWKYRKEHREMIRKYLK